MLFPRRAGALLLAAAMTVLPLISYGAPEVGVYRWEAPDGPANVEGFSSWLGNPVRIASLFHGRNTWTEIEGQDAQLSPWSQWVRAQKGRNLTIAVAMFPPGGSLASCAAGSYDAHWRRLADNLAYHGLHWAYLRLGWHMEVSENQWAAPLNSGKEASYAGCFRRIVQAMRQEQPANQWKFVFNVTDTHWENTAWLESVWPGDAYVDVVGVTAYDQSWIPESYPYPSGCDAGCRLTRQQNAWNHKSWQMLTLRNFAAAHGGKPLAFPEWGMLVRADGQGGGDNPYFVQKMRDFFLDPANNVVFHAYTNTSRRYDDSRLTDPTAQDYSGGPTQLPNGAALFRSLFGAQSTLTASTLTASTLTASTLTAAFSAPAAGATISGSFRDSDGCAVTGTGIVRVVFFMDNTQLNTESYAPWQCMLDTRSFANGAHTLRAVAYNAAGASTTVTRSVNVQNVSASGPTGVTFTSPAAGATISGSFSDFDGCAVTGAGIVRVVFFMDNTQLNTENYAPWQCALDTRAFANGTHTLRAVAYNSAGASTTVTRSVNVQNASASGPTGVTFTAPAAGATISGSFSDSDGCAVTGTGIVRVVFFMDSTQFNTESYAPWQCTLDTRNFVNGTHTLRAVAYNSAGASTTVTRSVNVQNTAPPPPPPSTTATLAWDAVTHPNLRGYRVYFGTAPRTYSQLAGNGVDVSSATTHTITGLTSGRRYYFAVKAYDASNNESAFSNEVFKDIP